MVKRMPKNSVRSALISSFSTTLIYFIITVLTLSCVIPMIYIISISITDYITYYQDGPRLIPRKISFHTYKLVLLGATRFLRGMSNSVKLTVLGVSISVFFTTMTGYAMSRRRLPGRRLLLKFLYISGFFSGGLIPLYLVLRGMGLLNSYFAIILPSAINISHALLAKNYFLSTFPDDIEESARLDGAGDLTILIRIVMPLSMAIIAVLTLFTAVMYWNTFGSALYFLQDNRKMPLMVILQQILWHPTNTARQFGGDAMTDAYTFPDGMRMTGIVVSVLPIMAVYPFLQRHFAKGIYIGALRE